MNKSLRAILCFFLMVSCFCFSVSAEGEEAEGIESEETEEYLEQKEELPPSEEEEDLPFLEPEDPLTIAEEDEAEEFQDEEPSDSFPLEAETRSETLTGLPVINLTIDPEEYQKVITSPSHKYRAANCSIRIDLPEGYESEYGEIDPSTIAADLELEFFRGRGNSTWMMEKKAFKLKLASSKGLLGMGKNKHWVLLANAMDKSLLRNRIVNYMANQLGLEFTPKSLPVDFMVNGEYIGSYVLSEDVRTGKTRVDINVPGTEDISEPEITGGYLLDLFPYYGEPEGNIIVTEQGVRFGMEDPIFESDDPEESVNPIEQYQYISEYLQKTENAIFGDSFEDEDGVPYSDYLDTVSAARYWWIQEFTMNGDAFITPSNYLYKKRNGKLFFGPVWDFDHSMLEVIENAGLSNTVMAWLDHLRAYDPAYQQLLKDTWQEYREILEEITRDGGILDQYGEEIRASWEKDSELYGAEGTTSFDAEKELIRDFINTRRKEIDEQLDDILTKIFTDVSFYDGDTLLEKKTFRIGTVLRPKDFPEEPVKEGYIFIGWEDQDGNRFNGRREVGEEEIIYHLVYVSKEDATKVIDVFLTPSVIYADLQDQYFYTSVIALPLNAQDREILWESMDKDKLEILSGTDTSITLELKQKGDAVLLAHLPDGTDKSFTIHIYDGNETEVRAAEAVWPESDTLVLCPDEYGEMKMYTDPAISNAHLVFNYDRLAGIAEGMGSSVFHALKPGVLHVTVTDLNSDCTSGFDIVVRKPLEETEISVHPSVMTFTGKALTPDTEVKDGDTSLTEGRDYLIAYRNNIQPGEASVILTGIGAYCGEREVTFRIRPKKEEEDSESSSIPPSETPVQRFTAPNTEDTAHTGFYASLLFFSLAGTAVSFLLLRKYAS